MTETFDFNQNLVLEDDFVQLRPLQFSDVENLLHISENEPETWKYSLVPADGKENLENYLSIAIKAREGKTEFPFVIFDKIANRYAGSTRFYDINLPFKTVQIGYTWYGRDFRGTGINKHIKYLMLCYAFEVMGMERVEFRADNRNEHSVRAMKSIGCKVDGILRSNMPTYGSNIRRDTIVLSILKDEWFNNVKEHLESKLR